MKVDKQFGTLSCESKFAFSIEVQGGRLNCHWGDERKSWTEQQKSALFKEMTSDKRNVGSGRGVMKGQGVEFLVACVLCDLV